MGSEMCIRDSFVLAGLNFGLFIRDYFVWPLFPTDGAVPELARPGLRY